MRINESQSCSKNLLHAKKNGGYWLNTINYSNIPVFLASTKEKKSIKCIWTISIWQIHKDHYQKFLSGHRIDDKFSYARFEIYIQTVFYPNSFLFFLGFKNVCQLLACRISKEIETMKNNSDRLKLYFAQFRPPFTCTFLALVFSVNKWKSTLVKKLAASKIKNDGYWLHIMHYSNIPVFLAPTKKIN